jgi:uncharacterized DUF497 family protein
MSLHVCTLVHIIWPVEAEWDGDKEATNYRKHGIRFEDALTVAYDPKAMTLRDDRSAEVRFLTIGTDSLGRILLVVGTWRGSRLRLISARRATLRERRLYKEEL